MTAAGAHEFVRSIGSYALTRRVEPAEGSLFEEALIETYGHSSVYKLITTDVEHPSPS